jgi:rubrerythrin
MSQSIDDIAILLENAIKNEVEGYSFYNQLARQIKNAEARKRLENLRDDEKRHKAILVDLYRKNVGQEIGELPKKGFGPLADAFDKGNLKKFDSEMEYIALAIETELAATKFYKEGARIADDAEFKKILEELSDEEYSHYELLMAEKQALSGNYFWFSSGDTSPMED